MKHLALVVLLVVPFFCLGLGCNTPGGKAFIAGFEREATSQLADATADAMDKKLGDDFKGLGETVRSLPAAIPHGPDAGTLGIYGTLGMLLAKLIGDGVKGFVRSKTKDKS